MSRAQGDGYRTYTDSGLNAYRQRLWDKQHKLIDAKEKWYRCGADLIHCGAGCTCNDASRTCSGTDRTCGTDHTCCAYWIHTEERNMITNPNGPWKWNGWEITGKEYAIRVYPADAIEVKDGVVRCNGLAEAQYFFDTEKDGAEAKDKANRAFKEAVRRIESSTMPRGE